MLCKIVCVSSRYGFLDIYANQINDNAIAGSINIGYLIPNSESNAATTITNEMTISTDITGTSTFVVTVSFNPSIITNWFVRPSSNSITTILDHVYRLAPVSV